MSKINFDTEDPEIEITRAIGKKNDGKITLNTEGGSIEIDLGFASIGATTDYGGAVSVGLLGQEITWGREGGTIHIGIGGFAVDVEAKDCIVTEIKSIFGIIVAQRSYPDPGCELPEPPEPFTPPELPPGPDGIQLEDGVENVFVVLQGSKTAILRAGDPPGSWYVDTSISEHNVSVSDIPDDVVFASSSAPFTVSENYIANRTQQAATNRTIEGATTRTLRISASGKATNVFMGYSPSNLIYSGSLGNSYNSEIIATVNGRPSSPWSSILVTPTIILYGSKTNCKRYIRQLNPTPRNTANESFSQKYIIKKAILVGKQSSPKPFLPTGNKPPMQNCCEEVLDMLEDIKEAYAVDRLLKDGFPFSNTFMAPGCDPASVTKAKNIYEIIQCVVRMMAHGMIFEPRVNIKDADAAKAGDQSLETKYLNATGWASAVAEALLEVKDDGNVSTNMDIRNGFAVTQTMVGVSDAIYRLNAILDSIGVELIPVIQTVDTPYNLQIQIGKGFGEGNERQIDLNQDEATEKLLPAMLQVKSNKIKTVDTHPRSRSIMDVLESIEANLPSNNNA